jgi:23S rRNA maturation mini-RNase III
MAAAVAPTQLETQYAGDAAGKVTAQVKEFASAQVDKVSEIAGRTLEAVKDEAAAQGLTAQGAKDAAAAVGDKLKTVAKRARNATT